MTDQLDPKNNALDDVKQLGLVAAVASLSYVFWVVGVVIMTPVSCC